MLFDKKCAFIVKTRLIHALLFVLFGNTAIGQRADSVVTINEIHYHPALTGEAEWVELHNQMVVRVDVSGWSFTEGIDFTFPEGSVMEPGDYLGRKFESLEARPTGRRRCRRRSVVRNRLRASP
jgi:hypothetical protein